MGGGGGSGGEGSTLPGLVPSVASTHASPVRTTMTPIGVSPSIPWTRNPIASPVNTAGSDKGIHRRPRCAPAHSATASRDPHHTAISRTSAATAYFTKYYTEKQWTPPPPSPEKRPDGRYRAGVLSRPGGGVSWKCGRGSSRGRTGPQPAPDESTKDDRGE